MQNLRLLVCDTCYDTPQEQLRAIVLPPDPTPVINARVENFLTDESGNSPVYGQPVGLEQAAIMPLSGTTHYGVLIPALSVTSNGTTTVNVTCSPAHGLSTGAQISVEGLSNVKADGFFSIVVSSAVAFSYQTFSAIPTASLLTPTSRIVTAMVGLPRGVTTIPQVGP